MKSDKEKRYEQEEENFEAVTINKLVCKDCAFAYKDPQLVSKCLEYPEMKPIKVLYGEDCDKYSKD